MALPLVHLNLTVADIDTSVAFYRRWFGFTSEPQAYEDGTVFVRNADGFDLAFHPGAAPGGADGFHFGFRATTAGEVSELRVAIHGAGTVPVVEHCDEDGYVNVKVTDPDGYVIEVYWEAP